MSFDFGQVRFGAKVPIRELFVHFSVHKSNLSTFVLWKLQNQRIWPSLPTFAPFGKDVEMVAPSAITTSSSKTSASILTL